MPNSNHTSRSDGQPGSETMPVGLVHHPGGRVPENVRDDLVGDTLVAEVTGARVPEFIRPDHWEWFTARVGLETRLPRCVRRWW